MHHYRHTLCLLFLVHVTIIRSENELDDPTVSIADGKVRGTILQSRSGRQYYAFRGIRYAKAPVGVLRFQPPKPADPWPDQVLDATEDYTQCPQFNFVIRSVSGEEDCLVVNIYMPKIKVRDDRKGLPVLFFIHGGGFIIGSGASMFYGTSRFLDKDIVLVTFNYRLGVLGFLSTGDHQLPGNYGMLDQIAALRWVQKNIAAFGGDPNSVTIFGESAGAVSVTHLMLSPLAKDLFHGAIAQSGSALCNWAIQKNPIKWTRRIAGLLECPTDDDTKMIECFKTQSLKDLVTKAESLQNSSMFPLFLLPVIDEYQTEAFLRQSPISLMETGKIANKVPLIIGTNKDEGYAFLKDFTRKSQSGGEKYFNGEFLTTLAALLDIEPEMMKKIRKSVEKEYIDDMSNDTAVENGITEILSDQMFNSCSRQTADLMSKAEVPTYAYQYSFIGKHSLAELYGAAPGKYVTHADELFIQFDFFFAQLDTVHPNDTTMSSILNSLWVNFATDKKPSFVGSPVENRTLEWETYDHVNGTYMELNLTPSTKTGLLCRRKDFWLKIIPKLLQKKIEKEL